MRPTDRGAGEERARPGPGWSLTLYPEAREASGRFVATIDTWVGRKGVPGEGQNPERSKRVASSRAKTAVRRYCAANRLNRLGTLTYAGKGCHDPRALRDDLADFFRTIRVDLGGKPFPYMWVPEWHKTDHGLHAHFACGQFIKRSAIEQAWGRGFINIKLLGDLPVGSGPIEEARRAGGYLSKYMNKDFAEKHEMGLHRYDLAQGFQPRKVAVPGPTLEAALQRVFVLMGGRPAKYSTSMEWRDWTGPMAVAMAWAS
jgi:hypothetical protein